METELHMLYRRHNPPREYIEPNAHIVYGTEDVISLRQSARDIVHVDDQVYLHAVGVTYANPSYSVVRRAENKFWRDQYVFEYVRSGKGHIECGNQSVTVNAGDFYFLNRLHAHHYYADADEPYEKLWFNVCGRLVNMLIEQYGISAGVVVRHCDVEADFLAIHNAVETMTAENRGEHLDEIALRIHRLIQILARPQLTEINLNDTDSRAEQIRQYIDDRGGYDITLDELSTQFNLNRAYLSRVFRRAYGYSPTQYIAARRIDAAKSMLSNASTPIGEIAEILHFSSSQHFSTVFRDATGLTPGQYRKGQ